MSSQCQIVFGLPLSPAQGDHLRRQLTAALPWLSNERINTLITHLVDVAGHYSYGEALRGRRGSTTNKSRSHLAVLLRDCEAAWKIAVGRTQPRGLPGARRDPPHHVLARVVHETVTGQKLTASLDRQARAARDITIADFDE